MPVSDLFDHAYGINLDRRTDMAASMDAACKSVGIGYERISAVDGLKLDQPWNFNKFDPDYWNRGALALVMTTEKIIRDAIEKGYESILIMEDDVQFDPEINNYIDNWYWTVPLDMQMFNFGVQHTVPAERVSEKIYRARFGFCCHCYLIKKSSFSYYLELLEKRDKQLDMVTCEDIQGLGTTYCFDRNLAFQQVKYSDINEKVVSREFLRAPIHK